MSELEDFIEVFHSDRIDIETLEDLDWEDAKRDVYDFLYEHNLDIADLEEMLDQIDGFIGNYCDL